MHHASNSFECSNTINDIQEEHLKKYNDIGYHYAVNCNGVMFEGRPIIFKGSHLSGANTHKIGIVMIGDFSVRGEADLSLKTPSSLLDNIDFFEVGEVPQAMHESIVKLITCLLENFPNLDTLLGEHKEFANKLSQPRYCPGRYGIEEMNRLRAHFSLDGP